MTELEDVQTTVAVIDGHGAFRTWSEEWTR